MLKAGRAGIIGATRAVKSKRPFEFRKFNASRRAIAFMQLSGDKLAKPVNAVMSASPLTGNIPFLVNFDGSASHGTNAPFTYAWDFGDGNNGTGETTSHTYSVRGYYTATLTVTDAEGNTDTTSVNVLAGDSSTVTNWGEVSYDTTNSATAAIYITDTLVGVPYQITISGETGDTFVLAGVTPAVDFVVPVDLSLFTVGTVTSSTVGIVTGNVSEPAIVSTTTISDDIYQRDPSGGFMIDPSGNMVKKSPWRGFGPTILTDGGFDSEEKWFIQAGNWTIGGGMATADAQGVTSTIRQNVSYTVGKNYRAMFDINVIAQGRVVVWIDGTTFVEDNPVTGRWTVDLVVSTASPSFSITVRDNFQGTIDNVVLMEEL